MVMVGRSNLPRRFRLGLPPVQGMPNLHFNIQNGTQCLGLPPVQGMPNSELLAMREAIGLGLPPVQGMPNCGVV